MRLSDFLDGAACRSACRSAWRWLALTLACLLAAAAPAAEPPVRDLYREAMLAITEGRLPEAERILADLTASEPHHAGAWLDLAMLYCATGNAALAERFFGEIEQRFGPPPGILAVIARQRTQGCGSGQPRTQATFRAGRGYESNVNQGARSPFFSIGSGSNLINLELAPEFRPRSDAFTQVSAEFAQPLSAGGATSVLQVHSKVYDRLGQFNSTSLLAGVTQPWRLGEGWARLGGSVGLMTLNDALYLKQGGLQIELAPALPLPAGWQTGAALSWSRIEYPTLHGFDAEWRELRGALGYTGEQLSLRGNAGLLQDRQLGNRPGGDRNGSSVALQGSWAFAGGSLAELGWTWQRWRGADFYFPGLIDRRRTQDTQTLRAAATLPVSTQHSLQLEYRQVHNNENISLFAYRNDVLQLNWVWQPLRQRY